MQASLSARSSPHCRSHGQFDSSSDQIGQLFRDYGEAYINSYKPNLVQIKLIRSIRVCKTPAMGGKVYTCKGCKQNSYVYFGCGNSRCPKCQGIKRMQWQDKLAGLTFQCPYVHMTFTMPHLLNPVARKNPKLIYNTLFRAAWSSLQTCCDDPKNLGAQPGVVMVLHTFGSDLKYHVHAHALVTFGGLDKNNEWCWPKRKNKIVAFRQIRNTFRAHFLKQLKKQQTQFQGTESFEQILQGLSRKSWCVHAEPPTANSKVIEEYLGKYICRIGLSKARFQYDQQNKLVTLAFKDYRNKKEERVPIAYKKMMPLVAIHQIMQHCLPAYFQKCRYYGLHAAAKKEKVKNRLPKQIKKESNTVRTLFQIIKAMLGLEAIACQHCGAEEFDVSIIKKDRQLLTRWLESWNRNKGSPPFSSSYRPKKRSQQAGNGWAMSMKPIISRNRQDFPH